MTTRLHLQRQRRRKQLELSVENMIDFDPNYLRELVSVQMPFGKYKGTLLCDLPQHYLLWFQREGFPPGKLGMLLATMYEIKLNGLEYLLKPLKEKGEKHK